MYDTFEPMQEFETIEFSFQVNNYEIWNNAKLINKGNCNIIFTCKNQVIQNINKTNIVTSDSLNGSIKQSNIFDKGITSNDRLVLLNLPENSSNEKIQMLSQIYGVTRKDYHLNNNEAYTCGIFLRNSNIAKLSFNLYGGDLLEVY